MFNSVFDYFHHRKAARNNEDREFDRGIRRYLNENKLHSNLAGPYPPHED